MVGVGDGGQRVELERDSLRRVEELWREASGEERVTAGEGGTGTAGTGGECGGSEGERVAWERLYTTEGAMYSVILADGTKVWLNAESELRYPGRFADSAREVAVRGEAYFEVAKEGGRPFRVVVSEEGARRGRLVVEVTGTEFNVRNYEEDGERVVVLVEGGVRVTEGGRELARLRPREGFEQEAVSGRWRVGRANVEREVAWRRDMFVFENESMEEIARQLGRWYGARFEVDPRLAGFRYSGNISRNESLERVLDILRLTKELEFMKGTGNEITVIPKV